MNYCTLDDIRGHVPDARLVEVTDDLTPNADGEIKENIVVKAIEEAGMQITVKAPTPEAPSVGKAIELYLQNNA